MSRTIIGKVGLTPKKDYDLNTSYKRLDLVSYEGSSYVCLKDCIGILPTNDIYWQLSASKGDLPINGVDYNTPEEKEEFKEEVIADSKIEIDDYTSNKTLELETKTSELIGDLEHQKDSFIGEMEVEKNLFDTNASEKIASFDKNAENKTADFNANASTKTSSFNTNAETLTNTFNENSESKISNFNDNATTKTSDFNNNAVAKTTEYDDNATIKTTEFNNNATEKTNTFNSNVETKTTDFNTNASTKQTEYDNNATAKLEEYNNNSTAKVNEFNENAESYEKRIAELETERDEIAQQMPWNTTDVAESIHVEDSAKYSRNKLDVFGNMSQETREGYNLIDTSAIVTQTKNGVTVTNNGDGSLTLNGTSTSSFGIYTEVTQKTISAGSYTIYIPKNTNIGTGLTASLGLTTSGAISITTVQPKIGIKSLELTEDLTYNQLRLFINSGTVFNNYVLKWMFVKGTYTADTIPPYEQYGAMPSLDYPSMPTVATGVQKIRRYGKNILSRNFVSGFIPITGEYPLENTQYPTSKYILLKLRKGKTYNLNCYVNGVLSNLTNGRLRCIDIETKTSVGNISSGSNEYCTSEKDYSSSIQQTGAITVKKDFILGVLFLIGTDTNICEIQIGENLTEYEKYNNEEIILDLGTTELCKITDSNGNVVAQDRAVYREVDGVKKWQWEKNVGKTVFDGTEKWSQSMTYLGAFYRNVDNYNAIKNDILICNMAKYEKEIKNYSIGKCVNNGNFSFWLADDTKFPSTTEWNTFLKDLYNTDTPLTMYYPHETAEHEDCTETQSLVLDKLYKLALEKGTNNIIVESENGVTTELQLTYMQDNNLIKEQEHKELEDRITALEELLSTTQTSAMLLDNMQSDLESEV